MSEVSGWREPAWRVNGAGGALTKEVWLGKFGEWFVPIPETGCWAWMGSVVKGGYGKVCNLGRVLMAHRVSYTLIRGPIPEGLTLDHLCRTPSCVNPDHLEAVTIRVNTMRSNAISRINADKTHCIRGHEFTPENTHLGSGARYCRRCWKIRRMQRKAGGS